MSKQIQTISFVAFVARVLPMGIVLLIGMQAAEAKQCSAAMPSKPQGHWSYRLIDGRKCWYEGENNFPKSLLQWPEQASALSAFDKAEAGRDEELSPPETQNQPGGSDRCCKTPLKESESFEARWRALGVTK
jgi:hypothetical protein